MRLCIIADDLTGALDASAPFAGRGLSVRVALTPGATARVAALDPDVLAVSTRSRDGGEAEARAAMAQVIAALPSGVRVFKKVDSRLKGHVAAELSVLDPQAMLVAPAIPDFDRVTRDGHVRGFGVAKPIDIRERLGALAGRAAIPDITTPDEMRAALTDTTPATLLVGARGLAEALAIALSGHEQARAVRPRAERALLVVGSRDPITLAQVDRATGATRVRAPLGDLPDPARHAATARLLVQATPGPVERPGEVVAQALAASVHPHLTRGRDAILLTGGATAEAVLARMGVDMLDLHGECLPGLPVAHAGDCCIIAKSGGFGDEDTLASLMEMFRGS